MTYWFLSADNQALARGYAIAATDTGHAASPIDGSWGLNDRRAEVDWAFRAVHRVAADGTIDRTRPVFPYPLVARYDATGGTDDAANFIGVMP